MERNRDPLLFNYKERSRFNTSHRWEHTAKGEREESFSSAIGKSTGGGVYLYYGKSTLQIHIAYLLSSMRSGKESRSILSLAAKVRLQLEVSAVWSELTRTGVNYKRAKRAKRAVGLKMQKSIPGHFSAQGVGISGLGKRVAVAHSALAQRPPYSQSMIYMYHHTSL